MHCLNRRSTWSAVPSRDILLKRGSPDLDFAVPSKGISLARRVADMLDADFMVLDDVRDTGRVIVNEAGRQSDFS